MKSPWCSSCAGSSCAGLLLVLFAVPGWSSEFRDTKYGYTISAPEFAAVPAGAGATRVIVLAPPDAGFAANVGVMVQEIKSTREEFVALSVKQFAATNLTLRSTSKIEVSGSPAVIFDYEGQSGGRSPRFLQLAVVSPERVLLVTCTATSSAFAGLEAEFRRSLESFRLTAK